eukprot:NODE_19190_length_855_cov_4.375000.p2 GENE.NODE_19190_length_855_cov_4.375000~~NODE_19190_length_855_cov_4.375000.p2  ORF type:complete len:176 (+),score=44.07 NODE_19190_length_855_cov_4.375000:18-545(+)
MGSSVSFGEPRGMPLHALPSPAAAAEAGVWAGRLSTPNFRVSDCLAPSPRMLQRISSPDDRAGRGRKPRPSTSILEAADVPVEPLDSPSPVARSANALAQWSAPPPPACSAAAIAPSSCGGIVTIEISEELLAMEERYHRIHAEAASLRAMLQYGRNGEAALCSRVHGPTALATV